MRKGGSLACKERMLRVVLGEGFEEWMRIVQSAPAPDWWLIGSCPENHRASRGGKAVRGRRAARCSR